MSTEKPRTLFTITVDTEEEWDWSSGYPTCTPSVDNIQRLPAFQDVCDSLNASVTYFVNHAVLDNPVSERVIHELSSRAGVEIGLHIHPWNTPPTASEAFVPVRESFLHNLPLDVGLEKLHSVIERFKQAGLSPTSFRGGRYSTCAWIQDTLYEAGCIADASVLPFTTWTDDGAPDFRQRGLEPVRRDRGVGKHGLWEIPLTRGFTRGDHHVWRQRYEWAERPSVRWMHLIGIWERVCVQRSWLNFENPLDASMEPFLRRLRKDQISCINFTMHSSSLLPGASPYVKSEQDLAELFHRMKKTVQLINAWPEFQSATVSDTARHLERSYHARSRD